MSDVDVTTTWRMLRLGEICRIVGGSTPSSGVKEFWDGEIIWITPTDLGQIPSSKAIVSSARRITESGYKSCGTEMIPVGSVVMSSRAPIGHLGIATVPLCTNQGCKSFIPSSEIDSEFLFFSLQRSIPEIKALGSGSIFSEVSKSQLAAFEISLPALSEQRRIAAQLRKQMDAVDCLKRSVTATLDAMDSFPESVFREAFQGIVPIAKSTDKTVSPARWNRCSLIELARLESGHTPSRHRPDWWGGDIPWLALPDIRALDCKVADFTKEFTNPDGIKNSSARILPKNTVALSRTASVGFVTIFGREMATSQDFVNWVCGPKLDPFYLMWAFRASREFLHSVSMGAIHKTIYMHTVEKLDLFFPPLPEQQRIAARLNEQMKLINEARASSQEQLEAIDALPNAYLREAFSQKV